MTPVIPPELLSAAVQWAVYLATAFGVLIGWVFAGRG